MTGFNKNTTIPINEHINNCHDCNTVCSIINIVKAATDTFTLSTIPSKQYYYSAFAGAHVSLSGAADL